MVPKHDERLKIGALIAYNDTMYEVMRPISGYVDVVDWKDESWTQLRTWEVLRSTLVRKASGEWVLRDSLPVNAEQ